MTTVFASAEYADRRRQVHEAMARRDLDALIVVDPANMYYLTGYDAWSFYVPQALVVLAEEEQPYWIGRPMDANGARLTTELDDAHIRTYPEELVQSADAHPMDAVAALVSSLGCAGAAVGVEKDAYYFTASSWDRLRSGLVEARLLDASLLVNWCRSVKSPQELALMRDAGRVASKAMAAAREAMRPGVRECDAAARIVAAQYEGLADAPGDYPAIVPLIPSGERTSAAHLTWTDRRYEEADVVNVELAGCLHRYHAPLARTMSLGRPSKTLDELAKVVVEGIGAAIEAVKPGGTCSEVEAAWRAVISRHSYEKASRLGYSVGIGYPPEWGEHTASLRQGDETVLRPGMTFHLIAGMWMDHDGLEISETIAVDDGGCAVLTTFPRELVLTV
jgi:ectoine hydrolase